MSRPVPGETSPTRPRIFGIGLNKTATTSLHEALTILGFESLHWGGPEPAENVKRAIAEEKPLLTYLDAKYDAFSDIGVLSRRFALLDTQYPGSRFILTMRPVDDWIDSRRRHVARNVALAEKGEYDGDFLVVDEPKWREEWRVHMERAHRYFAGRSDMLEIDLTAGAGWKPLCDLLELDEPSVPFPWKNRDKKRSDS